LSEEKEMQTRVAKRSHAKIIDFKKTFESEHGKRVLYELMDMAGYTNSPPPRDALELAYREGCRNMVNTILGYLKMNPEKLKHLLEDAHEHSQIY
jgi:hypothetical protein